VIPGLQIIKLKDSYYTNGQIMQHANSDILIGLMLITKYNNVISDMTKTTQKGSSRWKK